MKVPQVSIIIPVYNAAKYLEDCINSLVNQTLKDCEFIFVNDGSTDDSFKILKKHESLDPRIIILNQENKGVSIARNNGLAIAKGIYIGFVDADDWVEKDMYEKHVFEIKKENCDIVLSNMITYHNGIPYPMSYNFTKSQVLTSVFIKNELLPHLIQYDDLYSSCNKLFKKEIIKDYQIVFPERNALSEDNIFNMLYFNKIKSFKYIDYAGYHYRTVEGSATRNLIKKDYFQNALNIYNFNYRNFMDLDLTNEEIKKLKSEKFIKDVLSFIVIYLKPNKNLSFWQRYNYVKRMVLHPTTQEIVNLYFDYFTKKQNRFNRFLLNAIKHKSMTKIVLASQYTIYKNK